MVVASRYDRFDQIDKFINATLNPGGAFKVEQVFKFAPGNGPSCDVVESEGDDFGTARQRMTRAIYVALGSIRCDHHVVMRLRS
jgi:hypothetical protein